MSHVYISVSPKSSLHLSPSTQIIWEMQMCRPKCAHGLRCPPGTVDWLEMLAAVMRNKAEEIVNGREEKGEQRW